MKDYKFSLQRFADDEAPADEAPAAEETKESEGSSDKKYSDADLDKIISQKFAKWKDKEEKAIADAREEGKKLAKMTADQKTAYDLQKAQKQNEDLVKQLAELQAKQTQIELQKEAAKILKDKHGITADDDLLGFVVASDAETTNANIEKMAAILKAERAAGELARNTGSTPKATGGKTVKLDPFTARINKYK